MIDANRQLPAFYDLARDKRLSQGKISLYIALLTESCRASQENFEVSLDVLAGMTCLKKNTIVCYRVSLSKLKLIRYNGDNMYEIMQLDNDDGKTCRIDDRLSDSSARQIQDKSDDTVVASALKGVDYQHLNHVDNHADSQDDYHDDKCADDNTQKLIKDAMSIWGI